MNSLIKGNKYTIRQLMEMSVHLMNESIPEHHDKVDPKVGVILAKEDGTYVDSAFRGELRNGDHAEFTLLERKHRSDNLEGLVLFTTLEPCAPGARNHPKLGCAERIANARIKKVYIGIEDPDPLVDRKGVKYLIDKGIEVEMFDQDLQSKIWESNLQFIAQAVDRAKRVEEEIETTTTTTTMEDPELNSHLDDFSKDEVEHFISNAKLEVSYDTSQFYRIFEQLGFIENINGAYFPTGIGLLLFGKRPQLVFPNALIRATYSTMGRGEDIDTFEGSIVQQIDKIQNWVKGKLTRKDYEDHFEYDKKKAERHFKHFVELGLVKRMGSGPSTYYEYNTTI